MSRLVIVKVAACVLALKAYTLLLLYVFFLKGDFQSEYKAFLYLKPSQTRKHRLKEIEESFLERLAPYDGQFYLDISANGYRDRKLDFKSYVAGESPQQNYAFFPLLPLVLRACNFAGPKAQLAIMLVANAILAAAAGVAIWLIAKRLNLPAWPALLFLMTFPTAVYQSVLYTESLFLCLSVGLVLIMFYQSPMPVALLAYVGALCRPQGMLLAALSLGRLSPRDFQHSHGNRTFFVWVVPPLAAVLGVATFAGLLYFTIGSPIAFLGVQKSWGRDFSLTSAFKDVFGITAYPGPPVDRLGLVFGLGLLPFLWRYLPVPLAAYGTAAVAMPLLSGSILSLGRFLSLSFPHFLCLAKLFEDWKVASFVLFGGFVILQTIIARGLIGWYFVG